MSFKERIKNYGFWTGLAGAVGLLITQFGDALGIAIESTVIEGIITAVCGVLVVLGVVNNPTEGKWFADDAEEESAKETESTEE